MVPTVRLGTNLRHMLSARRCDDVRCDSAFLLLVKATDLDFLQVRFFVGRSMRERRALSTLFSREAVDVFDVSLNFSPSLNDLPDFLTMSE